MSTTDDLRSTLDRHASELTDHDLHVRPVAVRERIRVVRRRRRATVAGVAAAVVAAVALTVSLPGGRQVPVADRTLAGHAPRGGRARVVPGSTSLPPTVRAWSAGRRRAPTTRSRCGVSTTGLARSRPTTSATSCACPRGAAAP
jgi:hypothetical protein